MTTPLDIVSLALKDAGVLGLGQTPNAEDTNDAFRRCNWMLSLWARRRWLVYHLVDLTVASTGAAFYTIGPSGNINVPQRPAKIEAAYLRPVNPPSPNQVDYPLNVINAMEDYARITLKQLNSWPTHVFYDSDYPLGKLYFWPIPQSAIYQMHVIVQMQFSQFTSLDQAIVLPPEYEGAIESNLAVRLCTAYNRPVPQELAAQAMADRGVLKNANTQIARLQMPSQVLGTRASYNIYSDQQS